MEISNGIYGLDRLDGKHASGTVGVGCFGHNDRFGRLRVDRLNTLGGVDVFILSRLVRVDKYARIFCIVLFPPHIIHVAEVVHLVPDRGHTL